MVLSIIHFSAGADKLPAGTRAPEGAGTRASEGQILAESGSLLNNFFVSVKKTVVLPGRLHYNAP